MKTVFVLEGNAQDHEELQALLQNHGYTVTSKSDKNVQVSKVPQGVDPCNRSGAEKAAQETFLSSLDGNLYAVIPAENDAVEVTEPPQGVEQHFRGIYENGPLGIFRSSLDGKLLSTNPVGAHMLKYASPLEMIKAVNRTSIAEALYLDDHHRQEVLAQVLSSDDWIVFDEKFCCKDGSLIDCNFHMRAVRDIDGKPLEMEGFFEDISERKRQDEALRFTQFAIENTIDQAFWMTDDARLIYVNETACQKLGYSREELLRMSVPDIDPNFFAEVFAEHWRKLKEKGAMTFESRHRAKDGQVYPVEIRANYVVFDGKEYNCAFATDISERKQSEEFLLLSQIMIDGASMGIFRGSEDARILFVNDYWARKLGYTSEELCSMTFFDLDPSLTPEFWQEHRKKVADTGSNTFESEHRCKDGTDIPVEITVNLFKYRDQVYSCSFAKDICERKLAEKTMREANLVLENSPAVLFRWKAQPGWPVEMVSTNIIQFGYTTEELLLGKTSFSSMVHPEDLQRVAAEVAEHSSHGAGRFQQEYRIITKQGEVRWVDDRTVVERDANGGITHYQGMLIDITDRKRTECVINARMRLLQFAASHNLEELLEATLNEVEKLTESHAGFYHFLEDDQQTLSLQSWSTKTKTVFCKMQGKELHYPVSKAGVWVDCVHQRRPVIHNDYAALPHRKGLPPGHAPVFRELVVPVFRGEKIVAVLGVGNKEQNYTQQDVETVSLLADLAWTIVENKRSEEALRDSERQYRSIVEHAPFGITHSTKEGKLLSANPALASILKYDSPQELLETINRSSIQDVLFPKPFEREPLVKNIFAGDSWTVFNNRLRCKDGSIVTCRVHSRRIADESGQANAFESFQENITDQLTAEQALRESEEKFRVMAETSPVAICIYQGESIIYANPAMERLFGYRAEELYNMKFWGWVHEDCQELVRSRGLARLAGEAVPGQYEVKCLTKAGEELYALVSAGVMTDQAGTIGVASFLDITERKRTEELIRTSLKEKDVLLREIHHRVKNNLQVVSSLLYLQSQKLADPELQSHFLESQSRICSMALAHEQLYQSKSLAEVSVKSYVESLVSQLQQALQRPEQQIDCRTVVGDIVLDIAQIVPCGLLITEFLSNAYKHAFAGRRDGTVTISMEQSGDYLALSVADDGVGLPTGLDCRQATTLGLQLVAALVNQLNGTLEVSREDGTLFRVIFPESLANGSQ